MNYNTDPQLLAAFRKAHPEQILTVVDGQVSAGPHGFISRFTDDRHARTVLTDAGYAEDENLKNLYFNPDEN
jgi:hypothetical protein